LAVCTTILLGSISPSHAQQDQPETKGRKMLTKVVPIYPSLAQKMGIAGSVKVEVLVAPNGSAKSTQVLGGHPVLAQAGVEAIRYCKWEPATHETKEVVLFNFHPN
jgi:TonB family protein